MDKALTGTLASLSEQQAYPRLARPEDFAYTPVKTAQDGDGKSETNKLMVQTDGQMYPRTTEDGGMGKSGAGTPSLDRTSAVSKSFKVGKSDAEQGTTVSNPSYVNFKTGQHSCSQA